EQRGERRIVVEKAGVQAPILAMAWHIGSASDADALPLALLLSALADGEASRLHQRLVERDALALSVGSSRDAGFDPGLVWLYAQLPPGGDPDVVEKVISEELERIRTEGITPAELAKARKTMEMRFWRSLQTISGKAQALGSYEVFPGDYAALFDVPAKTAAVTATQVKT